MLRDLAVCVNGNRRAARFSPMAYAIRNLGDQIVYSLARGLDMWADEMGHTNEPATPFLEWLTINVGEEAAWALPVVEKLMPLIQMPDYEEARQHAERLKQRRLGVKLPAKSPESDAIVMDLLDRIKTDILPKKVQDD